MLCNKRTALGSIVLKTFTSSVIIHPTFRHVHSDSSVTSILGTVFSRPLHIDIASPLTVNRPLVLIAIAAESLNIARIWKVRRQSKSKIRRDHSRGFLPYHLKGSSLAAKSCITLMQGKISLEVIAPQFYNSPCV